MRSAREISLTFTILYVVGTALWLAYGIIFQLPPVMFWNAVALLLGAALLFAKIKYGQGK